MRELKFRVWDFGKKDNNDYKERMSMPFTLSDDWVNFENDVVLMPMLRDIDRNNNNKKRFHIMQYTGFKDRNGIEIYDGDIITFHSDDDLEDYGEEYWEVKFQNSTPVAWYSENEYRYLDRGIDSFSCEIPKDWKINVVGNIYENKELRND